MTTIDKQGAYFRSIETLNSGNKRKVFQTAGVKGSFDQFPDLSDDEFKKLEKAIVTEYLEMGKFSNYVFNEIQTKDEFGSLKSRYKKSKVSLFRNPGLDRLNWICGDKKDENLISFTFYKLKVHYKNVLNKDLTNDWVETIKLFVYDLEIRKIEGKIWAILKFPKIKPEKGKTYSYLHEWEEVRNWLDENLGCSMHTFDLKFFYENFKDKDDLVKISFDVENYEDQNQKICATNFSIKVNQTADLELSRIYRSIDHHLARNIRENLIDLYLAYCQRQNSAPDPNSIEFFQNTDGLVQTEMIFQAIQERCVYLIGGIRYKYPLRNGRERTTNFSLEKMQNQIGGILRSSREGHVYFDRIFQEVKEHFDPTEEGSGRSSPSQG